MKTHDLRHEWEQNRETGRWECACLISLPSPADGFCPNKVAVLREALAPVVAIADAYDQSMLDEWRPEWNRDGKHRDPSDVELVSARGGRTLLTLEDAQRVRAALRGETLDPKT
jgi:hypothetical protein